MNCVIVTAANDCYIKTMIDFIVKFFINCDSNNLIVYDIGLSKTNIILIEQLKYKYNFEFKTLNYDLYPEHVNVNKYKGLFCSYAFKPVIIYNEANNSSNINKNIIWMDSANRFDKTIINNICNSVNKNGFYSPISNDRGTIESIELNHPVTVKLLGLTELEHKTKLYSISANLVGLNYASECGKKILNEWYNYSLNKEFIMPKDSSRNNHRQDQTILSILMYLYEKNNNICFDKNNFGVNFWVKLDPPTVDNDFIQFKLINKETHQQLAIIYCKNIEEAIITYSNRKLMSIQEFLNYYIVV
jgi:hypothetical protein